MAEPYTVVTLSPLRKAIATRMVETTRTIPHFRLVADIEMDALLAARDRLNAEDTANKVTVNDCMIKACALALVEYPSVNIQLVGEEVHEYRQADISVVVAVEGGLSTPVIRSADRKQIRDIAAEVKALATRAAAGQLRMDEILGGTFSISNLGGYGVDQFDAIINSPQCAILAVGGVKRRMTVSEKGKPCIAKVLRVTLSLDHRAIDGVTGAGFLTALRQRLEHPQGLFAP